MFGRGPVPGDEGDRLFHQHRVAAPPWCWTNLVEGTTDRGNRRGGAGCVPDRAVAAGASAVDCARGSDNAALWRVWGPTSTTAAPSCSWITANGSTRDDHCATWWTRPTGSEERADSTKRPRRRRSSMVQRACPWSMAAQRLDGVSASRPAVRDDDQPPIWMPIMSMASCASFRANPSLLKALMSCLVVSERNLE